VAVATGGKLGWGRLANAKSIGWAIYTAGFAIWLFGYLSAGRAPLVDWKAATPWWLGPARFGRYRKPMGGVGVLPYLPPE